MRAALWPALICRCLGLQSLRYIPLSLSSSIFSSVRVPRCPHRCAPLTCTVRESNAGAGVQCHRRSAVAQGAGAGDRALARTPPHPCADLWTDSARSQPVDIVCYLLIMAGISLDAAYLPTSPRKIDVRSAQSFRSGCAQL